jgi:hypothetical protein
VRLRWPHHKPKLETFDEAFERLWREHAEAKHGGQRTTFDPYLAAFSGCFCCDLCIDNEWTFGRCPDRELSVIGVLEGPLGMNFQDLPLLRVVPYAEESRTLRYRLHHGARRLWNELVYRIGLPGLVVTSPGGGPDYRKPKPLR